MKMCVANELSMTTENIKHTVDMISEFPLLMKHLAPCNKC
jgi:hypothetical protein